MRQLSVLILLLFTCFPATFGQKTTTKILLFSKSSEEFRSINKTAIEVLFRTSPAKKARIDTTSNPAQFTESSLKNYQCVLFLNTSANALNYRQVAELQRFMQAGGGFAGVHYAAQKSYSSVWYQNLIGATLENAATEKMELSIITNASIGKTEVSPFWKITDKPLIFSELPTRCKPILLDVNGKTWAWHYTTDEGGKMFYTALGGEAAVYENQDFINHLWAGIEEVAAKDLPDFTKVAGLALPNENYFLKQILTPPLNQPLGLSTLPNGNCLIAQQDGEIKLYQSQKRKLVTIGKLGSLEGLKKLKTDPEFSQNGYIYAFFKTQSNPEESQIKRFQLMGDSAVIMNDFTSTSATPLAKAIKYSFAQFEGKPYRLPKYYDGKNFRYDEKEGLKIETLNENGELKNSDPFSSSMRVNAIQDMEFGSDGALFLLENNQLVKIDYSETNRPPVAGIAADVTEGKAPLKVQFSSVDSYDVDKEATLSFAWQFDELNTSTEANPTFTFTKLGIYKVKLKVTDTQGASDEKSLEIRVIKPVKAVVKKRRR